MNTPKTILFLSKGFVFVSASSLLLVAAKAFIDPQSVMDLVRVTLPNNDAISSIRGVYGGVGVTLFVSLMYLMFKEIQLSLRFLCLFWGAYAFSRTLTICLDGPLGDFGQRWLLIESILFLMSFSLLLANKKVSSTSH